MYELALLGQPFQHEEKFEAILEGLPDEYKPVVDQIECKDTPLSIPYIHERLCNHEAKLLSVTPAATTSPFPASAHVGRHNNNSNIQSKLAGDAMICCVFIDFEYLVSFVDHIFYRIKVCI